MPLFRRHEPLHEKLAREGALPPSEPPQHPFLPGRDLHGLMGETGIHGVARPRRWDAVATADASDIPRDDVHFVALSGGTLIVEEDVPDDAVASLADAIEATLAPPYRAEAVRRGETLWAVAARGIDVVELDEEVHGAEVELTVNDGERTLVVDGMASFGSFRSLERFAEQRAPAFFARARRIDANLWEVSVEPL